MFFFFFKQKTAYEMRISDWSSDVCSSDLGRIEFAGELHHDRLDERIERRCSRERDRGRKRTYQRTDLIARIGTRCVDGKPVGNITPRRQRQVLRSEEHTSELQSLMRISYAVFCLKKKK